MLELQRVMEPVVRRHLPRSGWQPHLPLHLSVSDGPPRPEPDRAFVLVLSALFLCACVAVGVGRAQPRFGRLIFNSNAILAPQREGLVAVIGPFRLRHQQGFELIFVPIHPRPDDAPDEFLFDWTLYPVSDATLATLVRRDPPPPVGDGEFLASGRVGFSGEAMRRDLDDPPIARVPVPLALDGNFALQVEPVALQDWPDVDIYIVEPNEIRGIAFIVGACLASVFAAFGAVAIRRHRAALAAWRRLGGDAAPARG